MEILRQFQTLVWCKPDWCFPSMSKETMELLKQCVSIPPVDVPEDIEEIVNRSRAFPVPFPIQTVRLQSLKVKVPANVLQRNIASTYPLIHERVLLLMTHFLIYKKEFGSNIEKSFYRDLSIADLIERILQKRAVTFMYENDKYTLLSGEEGEDGWEAIGTIHQKPPLTLDKCLSYDEMKLSAFLYVSGRTQFINDGNRHNNGIVQENGVENEGIIIGVIGPRFERKYRMDYEDALITEQQNCLENGYGEEVTPTTCLNVLKTTYVRNNQSAKRMWRQMWEEFYQDQSYTFDELTAYVTNNTLEDKDRYTQRFVKLNTDVIFDNEVYYKRLCVPFDCTLLEANCRAQEDRKYAFVNIVGIGLGVWKISEHQTDVFILTLLERVKWYLKKELIHNVSDVNIAFVRPSASILSMFVNKSNIEDSQDGDYSKSEKKIFFESKKHPKGGVSVQLSNRDPSSGLSGEHEGKLLVTTYPWDCNALPGNEFWLGSLSGSGDPAAACSCQISELHNAHINPAVSHKGLRVVTNTRLIQLNEYCRTSDM